MQNKITFDPNSPEIKAYLHDVHTGTFTREGTCVAFPTCLPGITTPIPLDESRITALDVTSDGVVCGGTSGHQVHFILSNIHGLSGLVFDVGKPEGAKECVAVCCDDRHYVAFANGSRGGRAYSGAIEGMHDDMIQEWGFGEFKIADHGECAAGEKVVHAVADADRKQIVGITTGHLFTTPIEKPQIKVVAEVPGSGRLAVASRGSIVGRDEGNTLWLFSGGNLKRKAVQLPAGSWNQPMLWARDKRSGLLYTADDEGKLFSFDEAAGFQGPLGKTLLNPVGTMAVTLDGRVFGFCGDEIAKMFCYDPKTKEVANLGVAASVIEKRRYGYVFGDAVTGREGELVFAENDNGGHLWYYFPRIRS